MSTLFDSHLNSYQLPENSEPYNPDACMVLVDGVHGVYTWQMLAGHYLENFVSEDPQATGELISDMLEGPDSELYHDASTEFEETVYVVFGHTVHFLATTDNGDIIAIPVTMRDSFAELEY